MADRFNLYNARQSGSRTAVRHPHTSSQRVNNDSRGEPMASQRLNNDSRGEPMATDMPGDSQALVPDLSKTQELFKMLEDVQPLVDKSKQELADVTRQMTMVTQDRGTVWKTKAEDLNNKINKQEEEIEELKKQLTEKDQEIKDTGERHEARFAELKEKALGVIKSLKQDLSAHEQAIQELKTERTNHKRDIDFLSERNEQANKQLEKVKEEKKNVEAELNATKTRLSKIMGNKLSDNNPDIADLSDMNRPTKIAEKFSELYDNEWTDAFEEVEENYNDEKGSVKFLLGILKTAKEHCDEMAAEHSQQISQALYFKRGKAVLLHVELQADTKKQVKDLRKSVAMMSMQQVQNRFQDTLKKKTFTVGYDVSKMLTSMKMQEYMNKCVEICWLMSVQDPPLTFGLDVHENEPFDKNRFKPYTKTGSCVDYLVWPEMFLKEGARLCKGVAQGLDGAQSARERHRNDKNDTSRRRPQTAPEARVSKNHMEEHQSYNKHQGSADLTEPQTVVDSFFQQGTARGSTRIDRNEESFKSPGTHTKSGPPRQHTTEVKFTKQELRAKCPKGVSQNKWADFLHYGNAYGFQHKTTRACVGVYYDKCFEHYIKLTSTESDV